MLLAFARDGQCYELVTHTSITARAVENYARAHPARLFDLGIFPFMPESRSDTQFDQYWYDMPPGIVAPIQHRAKDFEADILRHLRTDPLSADGWITRGAIREDDSIFPFSRNPQDEAINRPLNHFFDPVKTRALTLATRPLARQHE